MVKYAIISLPVLTGGDEDCWALFDNMEGLINKGTVVAIVCVACASVHQQPFCEVVFVGILGVFKQFSLLIFYLEEL